MNSLFRQIAPPQMQNAMQMMNDLRQFASGISGNPQQQVMQKIKELNIDNRQLNELQEKANSIYAMIQNLRM